MALYIQHPRHRRGGSFQLSISRPASANVLTTHRPRPAVIDPISRPRSVWTSCESIISPEPQKVVREDVAAATLNIVRPVAAAPLRLVNPKIVSTKSPPPFSVAATAVADLSRKCPIKVLPHLNNSSVAVAPSNTTEKAAYNELFDILFKPATPIPFSFTEDCTNFPPSSSSPLSSSSPSKAQIPPAEKRETPLLILPQSEVVESFDLNGTLNVPPSPIVRTQNPLPLDWSFPSPLTSPVLKAVTKTEDDWESLLQLPSSGCGEGFLNVSSGGGKHKRRSASVCIDANTLQ